MTEQILREGGWGRGTGRERRRVGEGERKGGGREGGREGEHHRQLY